MRPQASVLHLDLDAFFAAVEQRDKPSLRGKPVIVGGVGGRGVVATASYEARRFGVKSAMSMGEARRRCPHAAFLAGRFGAYRAASRTVMGILGELSPLIEPMSLDEAYVDLAAGGHDCDSGSVLAELAERVRAQVQEATGGLTASVGIGTSKFMAKLASELAKPDGFRVIGPGTEVETISPLPVQVVPGVGPVTLEKLHRLGVKTVADLQRLSAGELRREIGGAWGEALGELAFARDDRPIGLPAQSRSTSIEDTFPQDVTDRDVLQGVVVEDARKLSERLAAERLFARTVTLKVRMADFTTYTRSRTLVGATDSAQVIADVGVSLLGAMQFRDGVRLLGLGLSNFTEAAQEALFEVAADGVDAHHVSAEAPGRASRALAWLPGRDVVHAEFGRGWVWGSGLGRVTVRFETAGTAPGPIRTFRVSDAALSPAPEAEPESGPGWD